MKEWKKAIDENMSNLQMIASDVGNLTIRPTTRSVTVPQMVTWMLYAASVHDDFAKYKRYPTVDLNTYDLFITPPKNNNKEAPNSSSSSSKSSTSSSSSSSSASSYK
jgi:hypothetical protein